MGERSRVRQVEEVEEVKSEEHTALGLYGAMVQKINEMSIIALGLESGEQVAKMLSGLAMVKVNIEGIVEKIKEEEMIKEGVRRYEEGKTEEKGNE